MGEKPSPLGEDFSMLAVWNTIGNPAIQYTLEISYLSACTHRQIVWITKYRKPILRADIAQRVRELVREICKANDVDIIKGHVSKDHVHIFVSVPPHISISQMVQSLKGKTSRKLMMEYKSLSRAFWGRHMWARGYFAASSGNVTDLSARTHRQMKSS